MTVLSRPVVTMLRSALDTPTESMSTDIARLREALMVALRRCLGAQDADWPTLVELGSAAGTWNEWRIASLLDAADPESDETPEVTRETMADLATELVERGDVFDDPWEGGTRQLAVESEHWRAGRDRRELIFAIERAMDCFLRVDGDGLRRAADRIEDRDPQAVVYPDLAESLRMCADGPGDPRARARLRRALDGTPFAAWAEPVSGCGSDPDPPNSSG